MGNGHEMGVFVEKREEGGFGRFENFVGFCNSGDFR